MTLEELLHRAYGVAMTPLPPPPQLTPEQWARMKASAQSTVGGLAGLLPSLPEGALPLMPEWLRRYSEERGLAPWQEDGPGNQRGGWHSIPGSGMEQLDPTTVQHYNEYFGRR